MTFEPLKNKLVDKYPEDIFIELTKEQWEKIHELCNKEIGKPFDGFAGSISRHVLRNCVKDVKSAVNGLKKDISKFRTQNPCFDAWIYSEIMTLIHKWFEDVIE